MKRLIALTLCFCLIFTFAACRDAQTPAVSDTTQSAPRNSESGILIAYFTWAQNTRVSNPESIDVDASTSASVLLPGNTEKLASWIQQRVGGDLFSIVTQEPYSSDYNECLERAADEKAENARPKLVNHIDNMDDYDTIFLGFPNWWYTAPMAVFSFLEEYDLSSKTIVPFCAHGTGGLAGSIEDIRAALPESATMLEPIGFYRPDVDSAQPAINEWLDNLGFAQNSTQTDNAADGESTANGMRKIVMQLADGQEIPVTLYDTPAANALYAMLPLELTFEDFNGIEKISYLPQDLPTQGEPDGYDPAAGDLCLYAPWGNLSIFYRDFAYSDSLISLGRIDSGVDILSGLSDDFTVTLSADG